jgi:hypothetical protein
MAKRQERVPGSILAIDLGDGTFSYARMLAHSSVAFYDMRTTGLTSHIEEILYKPILFIAVPYSFAIERGRWKIIGHEPLEPNLQVLPHQLTLTPGKERFSIVDFFIYDPNEGVAIRGPWKEEYESYEIQGVWEPEHLEQRIRDHYAGVENVWIGLRKKHLESWKAHLKEKGEL